MESKPIFMDIRNTSPHIAASPRIWVLLDDRAGNRAQCMGIAKKLALPYETIEVRYTSLITLPNFLRMRSKIGIDVTFPEGWPDLVITAGRRCAPLARYIKRKAKHCKIVQLMWPDAGISDFDCIVLPEHDREHNNEKNILRVIGAPNALDPDSLKEAANKWQPRFAHLPHAKIAVLVGGSTRYSSFDTGDFHRLGALSSRLASMRKAGLMITTSRRTGAEGERTFMSHVLNMPHTLHSWQRSANQENPYMGYLALADVMIVSADSIAMCSEACATGKPVYIYQPTNLSDKHSRFVKGLIKAGFALPLREDVLTEWTDPSVKTRMLDSAQYIANYIRKQLLNLEDQPKKLKDDHKAA